MRHEPTPSPEADDVTPTVLATSNEVAASIGSKPVPSQWPGGLPPQLPARLGRYELLKLLGKGGMGAVYLAHDEQLHRLVALKIPHFGGPQQFQLADRFLREARVAATLSHQNLCPVYDYGQADGVLYFTMAYLEGKPLSKFIRAGQRLPPRAVVAVVRQLALAMAEAHSKGIIHRDLKPSNIMITPRKQAVIMDFGLARRTDAQDLQITQTGLLLGTPAYMPPEQLNSDTRVMGPGIDIYALGVILYELLAGRPPFQGPLGELMTRIMTEAPPPLARNRADLPPALDAICAKALAKKPAERFASMREFATALGDFLHGRYRLPEPEPESYEVVEDVRTLDEHDAAGLFQAMAARQVPGPVRTRRRRRRFQLPNWIIPLVVSSVALGVMGYALWWFFHYLERRQIPTKTTIAVGTLDPALVAEEQQRRQEAQTLEAALKRLQTNFKDAAARQELDAWLDSPSGKRTDLPPEVNFGLGRYLILERERWDSGLRRLSLSSDGPWRRAADQDLAAAAVPEDDAAAQLVAGDLWWNLADSLTGMQRDRLLLRAGHWYHLALPNLGGADAERIRRRMRVIDGIRRST